MYANQRLSLPLRRENEIKYLKSLPPMQWSPGRPTAYSSQTKSNTTPRISSLLIPFTEGSCNPKKKSYVLLGTNSP